MNSHKYKDFGHYRKISDLAGKKNLLSHTRDRYEMLLKSLIPNVLYTIQTNWHLKWQKGTLSLNLFNPMQTVIVYKAPNFMNCIKLVHKAVSAKQIPFLPPCLPTHSPPLIPNQVFILHYCPPLLGLMLGLTRAHTPLPANPPHQFLHGDGTVSIAGEGNSQSLTLEALPLKTKINSAIESIGHINTSTVSNFIHDI